MRIVKPSHFQTPNDLVDHWLPLLKEGELRILMVVLRKTFGWQKEKDQISLSMFEKITGMTTSAVVNSIKSLVEKGLIKKEITGVFGKEEVFYSLVVHDDDDNDEYIKINGKSNDPQGEGGGYSKNSGGGIPKRGGGLFLEESQKTITKDKTCLVCSDPLSGVEKGSENPKSDQTVSFGRCERKTPKGISYMASIEDIYAKAVQTRKNWTADEIEEAWKIFVAYPDNVTDYFNFIEGVITNLRTKKKNLLNLKNHQGFKCTNSKQKHSNTQSIEKSSPIMENDMDRQVWLTFLSQQGLR